MQNIIALTYDLEEEYLVKPGEPVDVCAEFDSEETIHAVASSLESFGYQVVRIGRFHNLLRELKDLKVDFVFNLAEGLAGRNRESQVPIILESLGIPYVGADALTLSLALDKLLTKKLLVYEGIPTPKFFEARNSLDLEGIASLRFPLIVKPRWEGSSKGVSQKSRVETLNQLKTQIDLVNNVYKQPALVEEFIQGREFTAAIIGNEKLEVFPILQVKINGTLELGDKFYVYDYIYSDDVEYVCPAVIDVRLKREIEKLALKTYRAVECRDFGRVDIRVDNAGNPYVLEINPLPSLSKADVFSVLAKFLGIEYKEMIRRILEAALQRYGNKDEKKLS